MTKEDKKLIEQFIKKPEMFNMDYKYWEFHDVVKNLYYSYNRKQQIIEELLKVINNSNSWNIEDHIPRID